MDSNLDENLLVFMKTDKTGLVKTNWLKLKFLKIWEILK
jgi:hypothetical protein